jgi:hypothetical protein
MMRAFLIWFGLPYPVVRFFGSLVHLSTLRSLVRDRIADIDLTLESVFDLPRSRTDCPENLRAALDRADDFSRCMKTRWRWKTAQVNRLRRCKFKIESSSQLSHSVPFVSAFPPDSQNRRICRLVFIPNRAWHLTDLSS